MKWRIVAHGAALVVTIAVASTAVAPNLGAKGVRPNAAGGSALAVLQTIRVENERPNGYQRSLFEHWRDIDGDGCDSRDQVLKRDSITRAQVDPISCDVIAGDWVSPYDGARFSDPSDIDIDHVVALKEAWDSGAWAWSSATRKAYANDTSDRRTLAAVTDRVNQQKSDKDPSNWLPPLKSYICTYIGNWIAVKARWELSMDRSEWGRIKNLLNSSCSGLTIAASSEAPLMGVMAPVPPTTPLTTPTTTPTTRTPAATSPTTTAKAPSSETTPVTSPATTPSGVATVYPGAWCKPEGAAGVAASGKSYVCAKTNASGTPYSDGRARWRQG